MSGFVGITIFLVVLVNLFKSYESAGPLPTGTRLKVCGSQLANLLSEICQGDYIEKRSKPIFEVDDPDYLENSENAPIIDYDSMDADYGYRTKRSLPFLRMMKAIKRVDMGIADECCRKSCSLNKLIGYCGIFQFQTSETPKPQAPRKKLRGVRST